MERPTLTTCMPTHNHMEFLPEALDCVLRQSRKPDQIIILDDASTDGTREYLGHLARAHPEILIERNASNEGVIAAINRLASWAQTRYVHFLASDDLLLEDFYARSLGQLARHPEAGLSCMPFTWFCEGEEDRVGEGGPWWSPEPRFFSPEALAQMSTLGSIHGNTVVIDREAFLAAGGLIPELEWRSDWFCNWVAGFRRGMVFIPAHSALVRLSGAQYSTAMADPRRDAPLLAAMVRCLRQPEYADVLDRFIRSDTLFSFDFTLLYLAFEAAGWTPGCQDCLKRLGDRILGRPQGQLPEKRVESRYSHDFLRPRIAQLVQDWNRRGLKVVLFGAGEHTSNLFKWTTLAQASLLAIVDNNERIHGKVFWNLEVHPVAKLAELKPDVVLLSTATAPGEIIEQVRPLVPAGTRLEHLYG